MTTAELAQSLLKPFSTFYDDMYDGRIEDCPDKYVRMGDRLLKTKKPLARAFAQLREDILSSDREVAAFAMAYQFYK